MMNAPIVGMAVKLRKGQLLLSAKQVQHVTAIKKLTVDGHDIYTQEELDAEGGYWIKTDYTKGEWWAWSLFRIA
jgi:hypothetical protein